MKIYVFPYGGSFGGGDSWDNTIEFGLTNKEADRLEESARGKARWEFGGDPTVSDIYVKVYKAAYNQEIRNVPIFILDELRRDKYHGSQRISNRKLAKEYLEDTSLSVFFPDELLERE